MKKRLLYIVAGILVAAVVGFGGRYAQNQAQTPPSATFDSPVVIPDGKLLIGKTYRCEIALRNPGLFPEKLSSPESGCACTTAALSSGALPSFGKATLTLFITPDAIGDVNAAVAFDVSRGGEDANGARLGEREMLAVREAA